MTLTPTLKTDIIGYPGPVISSISVFTGTYISTGSSGIFVLIFKSNLQNKLTFNQLALTPSFKKLLRSVCGHAARDDATKIIMYVDVEGFRVIGKMKQTRCEKFFVACRVSRTGKRVFKLIVMFGVLHCATTN